MILKKLFKIKMRVPQNVSLDIFFLTATLHLVIKFKYKQHLVILCQANVGGGCEWVGLVCVFKMTKLIFLKQKFHE